MIGCKSLTVKVVVAVFLCQMALPLGAWAQSVPGKEYNGISMPDSINTDGTAKKKKNLFVKARDLLVNYLDYYDFDTAYISPSKFYYTLMLQQSASFENYIIRNTGERPQMLHFAPQHSHKIGVYFGWHSFFLGLSANTDELFAKRKASNKKTEYYLNMYGYKLGADFFYRSTGNDFNIKRLDGFQLGGQDYNFKGESFAGLKVKTMGLNLYYVFNNKHFSYPAAYAQTTVQKISRGTLVGGISWLRHHVDFDYTRLPLEIKRELDDNMKFNNIKYTDININFGYAFNWVFADNWLLAVALTPALAYKVSRIDQESAAYDRKHHSLNLDFITRTSLTYNNNRFFAGANTVSHVYQYYRKDFALTDNFGRINVYVGFNFGRRK